MENRSPGRLWPVSVLTIGGGGLGHVWGPTSRAEAVATLREAVESGITAIDVAPNTATERPSGSSGSIQRKLPEGVRVLTKCHVGKAAPAEVENGLVRSLDESLGPG